MSSHGRKSLFTSLSPNGIESARNSLNNNPALNSRICDIESNLKGLVEICNELITKVEKL